jgi:hypothetical protein
MRCGRLGGADAVCAEVLGRGAGSGAGAGADAAALAGGGACSATSGVWVGCPEHAGTAIPRTTTINDRTISWIRDIETLLTFLS